MLHINPLLRPSVQDILDQDDWINDPQNIQTVDEYVHTMHKIYLVNHGYQPDPEEETKDEDDNEVLKNEEEDL